MGINKTATAVEGTKPLLQIENQIELSRFQIPVRRREKAEPFKVALEQQEVKKPPLWKRVGLAVIKKLKPSFKTLQP